MRILVVEDEMPLAQAIASGLSRSGYSVDIAYDGEAALEMAEINDYDLLLLDLNLPKIDGVEVCRRLRTKGSQVGILMLTARSSHDDRITGLDSGADDYLVKPFHFGEMLARVRAVLRREGETRNVIIRSGDLVVDTNSLKVFVSGKEVSLTTKEFGILEYLVRNVSRVVSQEELLEHVWNEDANLFTQAIKVHINNIRRKLATVGEKEYIETIKGRGYLITEA
ncbi:MAG: response regulator transcription factor [Dehalococcoidia bacterium]|nr:response regulator transcription factor [Dehalococcoidia bacterium]